MGRPADRRAGRRPRAGSRAPRPHRPRRAAGAGRATSTRRPPSGATGSSRPGSCRAAGRCRTTRRRRWRSCTARAAEQLDEQVGDGCRLRGRAHPARSRRPRRGVARRAGGGRAPRDRVTTDQASRIGELLEEAGRAGRTRSPSCARLPPPRRHRPRARLALRRVRARAVRAAAAHRPRAVRRDPHPAPDERASGS